MTGIGAKKLKRRRKDTGRKYGVTGDCSRSVRRRRKAELAWLDRKFARKIVK
jgi:hypothetical protein